MLLTDNKPQLISLAINVSLVQWHHTLMYKKLMIAAHWVEACAGMGDCEEDRGKGTS